MKYSKNENTSRYYRIYLIFMLIACSGAFIWQFFLPNFAGNYSSWGNSIGWQREIALWNIAIITVIIYALIKRNDEYMKILTIQCTVLCLLLGANHLVSWLFGNSSNNVIHVLGVFEVLIMGGIGGLVLLWKTKNRIN